MEFLRTFFSKQRIKPTNSIVLRKTDDEIQRYVKQTTLTKKRRSFEHDLGIDLKAEEDELNTMDKRVQK